MASVPPIGPWFNYERASVAFVSFAAQSGPRARRTCREERAILRRANYVGAATGGGRDRRREVCRPVLVCHLSGGGEVMIEDRFEPPGDGGVVQHDVELLVQGERTIVPVQVGASHGRPDAVDLKENQVHTGGPILNR